jgi:hypothetical protein
MFILHRSKEMNVCKFVVMIKVELRGQGKGCNH